MLIATVDRCGKLPRMISTHRTTSTDSEPIGRIGWLCVIALTLLIRLIVLASGAVSFHSDEAIVGLMARHINYGLPVPTFFYGQAYMGSLDPLMMAAAFRILGESVLTMRIVESAIYMLTVITTVILARRLTGRRRIALGAGLLMAVPPVVMTLYTTMSLGGYGETLLFGNLVLLLGFEVINTYTKSRWRWALLGLIAGLGWWTDGLIIVYALPIVLIGLTRFSGRNIPRYAIAALTFLIGGIPWWRYNFNHDWEALHWLIGGLQSDNGATSTFFDRALGFLFIGLPAAMGIRYSWTGTYWTGALGVFVVFAYVIVLFYAIRLAIRRPVLNRTGRGTPDFTQSALDDRTVLLRTRRAAQFLLVPLICFAAIFLFSAFGSDPTGRYLLPLIPTLSILIALFAASLSKRSGVLGWMLIGGLLLFEIGAHVVAITNIPPGITPQFDSANDFRNDSDQAAIDFLLAHNGTRGYGTYWTAFRLAFVSHEAIVLDAGLPYKTSLIYSSSDRRYPPYTQMLAAADHPVYVTAGLPGLDTLVATHLHGAGVTYARTTIGPYTIFYDLSRRISPDELGLQTLGH